MKLTPEQIKELKEKYQHPRWGVNGLARYYNINIRTVVKHLKE
jgi:DNA-binding MarR family transcriptional regulator